MDAGSSPGMTRKNKGACSHARYAELDVTTNFSFLRGGSHPEELVATAKALGLEALAVTDRNTLAGVVRAHLAAKEVGGIKFIVGARLDLEDAPSLLAYPKDRAAYGRLCRLLTLGQRRAEKGQCTLTSTTSPPMPRGSSSSRSRPTRWIGSVESRFGPPQVRTSHPLSGLSEERVLCASRS